MDQAELKNHKRAIRAFLRTPIWTEEKLCALLAHAESKLSMWSCCCLIGVPTADHALRGLMRLASCDQPHFLAAIKLPSAGAAECAFHYLSDFELREPNADEQRRRRIRPIIRAELKRRALLRNQLPLVAGEDGAEQPEAALSTA